MSTGMAQLGEWSNFYVIVGSAAGALIGLQFVVIALIAERPVLRAAEAGAAFATPTIVHFGAVMLLSALVSAPWHGIGALAALLGFTGFGGVAYTIIVARRMRVQTVYRPQFEDWLLHVLVPLTAYATLAAAGLAVSSHLQGALFTVAAAAMLLLFTGIHNAWDAVTYHLFVREGEERGADRRRAETPAEGDPK